MPKLIEKRHMERCQIVRALLKAQARARDLTQALEEDLRESGDWKDIARSLASQGSQQQPLDAYLEWVAAAHE